jgi:hypothetical protein
MHVPFSTFSCLFSCKARALEHFCYFYGDVASLNYASLNYQSQEKLDDASLGLCVPRIMRPWDYASLGRFVPGRFVTICPHFSGRTIHPHFEKLENVFGCFIPEL